MEARKRSNVRQRATWPPPWQCVDPKVAPRQGLYSLNMFIYHSRNLRICA